MQGLSLGSTIAGCRLDAVAGRGGMGVVYRATQLALDRTVAVKAIAPALAADADFRERFQRESHLAASIEHPNVIPVYEAGELDGTLYLIMRWVDGTDLHALLASEGRLSPARAATLLRPVASALAAAHQRGLVHRDVKPANVLIARAEASGSEHVYLTDFGIARRADSTSGVTRTGVFMGTTDYTAPERVQGGKGTAASDIYAFGCMLFQALTGHVPFDRGTELARMAAHVYDQVPAASAEVPGLPPAFDAIIATAMAKDPADRYRSADEIVLALEEALGPGGVDAGGVDAGGVEESAPVAQTAPAPAAQTAPAVSARGGAPPLPPTAPPPTAATPPQPAAAPEPIAAPTPPRRHGRVGALVAGLAAVVAVIAVVAATSGGGSSGKQPAASVAGAGAPSAGAQAPQVLGGTSIGFRGPFALNPGTAPVGLAADGADVWVAEPERSRIVRVGPDGSGASFAIAGHPDHVAVDPLGHVWVAPTGPSQVTVLDPATGRQTPVPVGLAPRAIAVSAGAAWVADTGQSAVTRIDLNAHTTQPIPVPAPPVAIASAYGRVWIAGSDGSLTVLDESGQRDDTEGPMVPRTAVGITHSDGVWVLSAAFGAPGKLTRVNPIKSTAVAAGGQSTYVAHADQGAVGTQPAGIAASGAGNDHTIWVTSAGDASLRRIGTATPHDKQTLARIAFPRPPGPVTVGDQGAWVEIPSTGQLYLVTGP
jgi:Protein kinase domain